MTWGAPIGEPTRYPLVLPGRLLSDVREQVSDAAGDDRAGKMTARLLTNIATTTIDLGENGEETWVITGDIPAMWLRDSCLQLSPLLRLAPRHPELAGVAAGLLRRHWRMILVDPYAILTVAETEQQHEAASPYRFTRPGAPASDTLTRAGRGPRTRECGLVFQAFRPSDDACQLGFNIPGNAFFASTLRRLAPILDGDRRARAERLATEIEEGIRCFGMIDDLEPHLAYEVDGWGGQLFMDDANLPSLLGLPYLGVLAVDDPVYLATRRRILSPENPCFVDGTRLRGIGSPHTPPGHVWPIAIAIAGLTATDREEKMACLRMLMNSTGGTGWMHEGVDADDPSRFTRPWFSWANAMFCELALAIASLPGADSGEPVNRQQ